MHAKILLLSIAATGALAAHAPAASPRTAAPALEAAWTQPDADARVRAYWWWLNGNVDAAAITSDLEQMKAKGFSGAILCDADGSAQDGNERVPAGPLFGSPEWRKLYRHALAEAARLGLELSLNIQSGWNLGGPMVTPEEAPKKMVWSGTRIQGGASVKIALSDPPRRDRFFRDLFVLAHPARPSADRRPIVNLGQKSLATPLKTASAPTSEELFAEAPPSEGDAEARAAEVVDLTAKFDRKTGALAWEAPPGEWEVIRFGFTLNDHSKVSTSSGDWQGYALDPFDAKAFTRYWDAVVEPLLAEAGPHAGKALRYLHTDSWEVEVANWTPTLREEFLARRGYDLLPWLPVLAGRLLDSRDATNRFLHDFRKTFGELGIDHHYRIFRDRAHARGLLIHPESGGPHAVPIDAQRCLGWNDAPMSEFWAWSPRHRTGDSNRFFLKQPASAAHTYGRKLVLAEGFTTIGPHWQERIWNNLKPSFDKALCEGMNVLVWHAFTCTPESQGIPGQQYFAGTHLNPNVTWWSRSKPFFDYINRCQSLLQQGLFVADAAFYYGDHVPNFTQLKKSDPAKVLPGYDYDVFTEETLLTRVSVRDGRLRLPDGMSYRALVIPDRPAISLPVLRKIDEWVRAGATVIGPRPERTASLTDAARNDAEVAAIAAKLWGGDTGKGRVIADRTAREVFAADGLPPDCELACDDPDAELGYIHRATDGADIYFVANRSERAQSVRATFRVDRKAPELWDPVSGERRFAAAYSGSNGRTTVPLELPPCGSMFVVFRSPASAHPPSAPDNALRFTALAELPGPWSVKFDPRWGGPAEATFETLADWTQRPEPGIKFYAGTATYRTTFQRPASASVALDLGDVRELAEIRLNGRPLGIVWTPPFRVDLTPALKPGENALEIDVVNFWPNRIIGDASLPPEQRLTKTNVRKLTPTTALMPSGLLGPVRLVAPAK
jgi:hypothetical protein